MDKNVLDIFDNEVDVINSRLLDYIRKYILNLKDEYSLTTAEIANILSVKDKEDLKEWLEDEVTVNKVDSRLISIIMLLNGSGITFEDIRYTPPVNRSQLLERTIGNSKGEILGIKINKLLEYMNIENEEDLDNYINEVEEFINETDSKEETLAKKIKKVIEGYMNIRNEEDLTITVEGIDEYSKKRNAKQKE